MESLHTANAAFSGIIYGSIKVNTDQREIRLLKLLQGGDSDPLQCNLFTTDLGTRPRYQALSYAWGDALETETIQLNHHDFSITKNLHAALCRLRLKDKCRVLWIDALCINQCEVLERNHQVRLMRDIYQDCDEVLIWLGEPQAPQWDDGVYTLPDAKKTRPVSWNMDDHDSALLEDFWQDFSSNIEPRQFDYTFHLFSVIRLLASNQHLSEIPSYTPVQDLHYPFPFSVYRDLIAATLEVVMNSPWWFRLWTAQECILQPKATLLYGPISSPLDMFEKAFQNWYHHFWSCCARVEQALPAKVPMIHIRCFNMIDIISIYRDRESKPDTLFTLLYDYRHRVCSDDRDKVFGLLGLVTNWLGTVPVLADYDLEVRAVYEQVVLNYIQGSQSVHALVGDLDKHSHPELATWVTDWTFSAIESDGYQPVVDRVNSCYYYYKAAGSTCVDMKPYRGSILCLAGCRIDRILVVGDTFTYERTVESMRKCYVQWYLLAELHKDPHRAYCRGGTWSEAFWRTFSGDLIYSPSGRRRILPGTDEVTYISWCTGSRTSPFHPEGLTPEQRAPYLADDRFAKLRDQWSLSYEGDPIDRAINPNTNRKFFITEGGLMGVGPPSTTAGDEVYVLFGGGMPFILSDSGKQAVLELGEMPQKLYHLRGDAYVHGIMDGEAIESGSIEVEKVHLI